MEHVSYTSLIKYLIFLSFSNILLTFFFIKIGIPVIYALLPDRKAVTYIHLFNVLFAEAEKLQKRFDPSLIMTDFEPGLCKAISLQVKYS